MKSEPFPENKQISNLGMGHSGQVSVKIIIIASFIALLTKDEVRSAVHFSTVHVADIKIIFIEAKCSLVVAAQNDYKLIHKHYKSSLEILYSFFFLNRSKLNKFSLHRLQRYK
jgi:hypothetical protein